MEFKEMKSGLSSIRKNLVANLFGIGVLIFNQVILVPVYLHFWDVEVYSDWIVLTAISSFFAMSDIGLNSVTINQFVIKNEEGNIEECKSLMTNNYLLVIFVFLISIAGSAIYVFAFDIVSSLGLHAISREESNYIFLMLVAYIFIGMISSVPDAIYRSSSLNHKAVYINNCVRLAEGLMLMTSLFTHLSITYLVTLYLIPRIVAFFYKFFDTKNYFPYKLSIKSGSWSLFKKIFYPSITFMFFPIGNGIIFQGFSLLVNRYFGAQALVLYNTTRTLTSFLNQLLGSILQAVWPEFSIAYGKKDVARMRELHRKAFVTATAGAILISLMLLLFGRLLFTTWTHGKLEFNFGLLLSFLVVLVFRCIWNTSSVALMATNRHSTVGILFIVLAILSMGTAVISTHYYHSLILTVYCLLVIEIGLSIYTIRAGVKMTNDTFLELVKSFKPLLCLSIKKGFPQFNQV
ncbi:oligosaccharide flippase family protein [Flavihumibacter sp. R14]|nr:oligosaccharide flippase family protein [Flavihumibacter soli]